MKRNQNVQIPANNELVVVCTISVADGSLFDPTGATGVYIVAKAATSTGVDILITKSTDLVGGGAAFVQSPIDQTWSLQATLVPADTATLPPVNYYHEATIIEAGGKPETIMTGQFSVIPTVYR
jgi:hypothetical protein